MDFYEARSEYLTMMDGVQALFPGEWTASEPGSDPCVLENGAQGAHMFTQRTGPGVADGQQQAAIDQVAAVLDGHGFPLSISRSDSPAGAVFEGSYPASRMDATGLSFRVIVSPVATVLSGTSACGTGDSREINRERQENGGYPGE